MRANSILTACFVLFACTEYAGAETPANALFGDTENPGFYALTLPIRGKTRTSERWIIRTNGTHESDYVALDVELRLTDSAEHRGTREVRLTLPDQERNALLTLFASAFKMPLPKRSSQLSVTLHAVVSDGANQLTDGGRTKFELMRLSENTDYGEWYLDIDLGNSLLKLAEKNQQYREPFLSLFFK